MTRHDTQKKRLRDFLDRQTPYVARRLKRALKKRRLWDDDDG